MYEELLYKKIRCSDLGVLCTIFPNFKIERSVEGFIYMPSIYCGPANDIQLFIEKCDEPYVIVSPNGDIDLDDRDYLIKLALKKHNIQKKLEASSYQTMPWGEFLNFWKYLWVIGEVLFLEKESTKCLDKIFKNLEYPKLIVVYCLIYLDNVNVNINYIFKRLLLFITNAKEVSDDDTEEGLLQKYFINQYGSNISYACERLLHPISNNIELQFITFIIDLFIGGRKSWMENN